MPAITINDLHPKFIEFLTHNGCIYKYIDNLEKSHFDVVNLVRQGGFRPGAIRSAFGWGSSPEGYDFWYQIHTKWLAYWELDGKYELKHVD